MKFWENLSKIKSYLVTPSVIVTNSGIFVLAVDEETPLVEGLSSTLGSVEGPGSLIKEFTYYIEFRRAFTAKISPKSIKIEYLKKYEKPNKSTVARRFFAIIGNYNWTRPGSQRRRQKGCTRRSARSLSTLVAGNFRMQQPMASFSMRSERRTNLC